MKNTVFTIQEVQIYVYCVKVPYKLGEDVEKVALEMIEDQDKFKDNVTVLSENIEVCIIKEKENKVESPRLLIKPSSSP